MPDVNEILNLARGLSATEREQLGRALSGPAGRGMDLPLASPAAAAMARPDVRDPVGWRKAERGHAVLATDTPTRDDEIPAARNEPAAIRANRYTLTKLPLNLLSLRSTRSADDITDLGS